MKIEKDIRFYYALRGQETMNRLLLKHFISTTALISGQKRNCISCKGQLLHIKKGDHQKTVGPPKYEGLLLEDPTNALCPYKSFLFYLTKIDDTLRNSDVSVFWTQKIVRQQTGLGTNNLMVYERDVTTSTVLKKQNNKI